MKRDFFSTENVESKRTFIINVLYVAIISVLLFLVVKYVLPTIAPILIAIIIAAVSQWPIAKFNIKKKSVKAIVAILVVVLTYTLVLTVIYFSGKKIISELISFKDFFFQKVSEPMWLETISNKILDITPDIFKNYVSNFLRSASEGLKKLVDPQYRAAVSTQTNTFNINKFISAGVPKVYDLAKNIPAAFFGFVITVVLTCFIAVDYDELKKLFISFIKPEKRETFLLMKNTIFASIKKILKSYVIILFVTFCELYIAFNIITWAKIMDGKYKLILALIIALFDILPILGTGTFLGPWILYSLVVQDYKLAIALAITYIIITVVRQIIEPKLIATQFDLNPAISLMSMFIGAKLLGFVGLFLFPMMLFLIKMLQKEGYIGGSQNDDLNKLEIVEKDNSSQTKI
ncbi:MAG: AI-2E family transporter [Clostridia bacterium]|nr:AI-2E family transporter [Clostridia bacterium]